MRKTPTAKQEKTRIPKTAAIPVLPRIPLLQGILKIPEALIPTVGTPEALHRRPEMETAAVPEEITVVVPATPEALHRHPEVELHRHLKNQKKHFPFREVLLLISIS